MAIRWRVSESFSAPKLVALVVRKYASAGVLLFLAIVHVLGT
jgi:hypothetical protein